jgi:hypothetical protein
MATTAVLAITELQHLDTDDLISCFRVCKKFYDVLTGTKLATVRQKLFLLPISFASLSIREPLKRRKGSKLLNVSQLMRPSTASAAMFTTPHLMEQIFEHLDASLLREDGQKRDERGHDPPQARDKRPGGLANETPDSKARIGTREPSRYIWAGLRNGHGDGYIQALYR